MSVFEISVKELLDVLEKRNIQYYIIGGFAAIGHGFLRATEDIDITVLIEPEKFLSIYDEIEEYYQPLFRDFKDIISKLFILPLRHKSTGFKIDVSFGFSLIEEKFFERSRKIKYGEIEVNVCSLEDLILQKLIAYRGRDMDDIKSLIQRNRKKIDWNYLEENIKLFERAIDIELKERFDSLMKEINHGK
jgi:predicted nucleotidyltransferase